MGVFTICAKTEHGRRCRQSALTPSPGEDPKEFAFQGVTWTTVLASTIRLGGPGRRSEHPCVMLDRALRINLADTWMGPVNRKLTTRALMDLRFIAGYAPLPPPPQGVDAEDDEEEPEEGNAITFFNIGPALPLRNPPSWIIEGFESIESMWSDDPNHFPWRNHIQEAKNLIDMDKASTRLAMLTIHILSLCTPVPFVCDKTKKWVLHKRGKCKKERCAAMLILRMLYVQYPKYIIREESRCRRFEADWPVQGNI